MPDDHYIGGECLAEGYFKRPEPNAQKLVADPFYRTGEVRGKVAGQYQPKPYSGKLVFIRVILCKEDSTRDLSNKGFGGKKNVSGPVAVHNIPGIDHHHIFAQNRHVQAVDKATNLHPYGAPAVPEPDPTESTGAMHGTSGMGA